MSDTERRWHEEWLGLVQPIDGLVVSIPALLDAQCFERLPPAAQHALREHVLDDAGEPRTLPDLAAFLEAILDWTPDLYDTTDRLPDDLALYVPEGRQTIRPTLAVRHPDGDAAPATDVDTPAARAARPYQLLVWQVPDDLPLDAPETTTGPWHYPPAAKFDRLLRHTRTPIGLLTNGRTFRLVYAPHGESSGSITFHLAHMAEVGGRPILDAFVMLLSAARLFSMPEPQSLPAILRDSRLRQGDVTENLANQVREALEILLAGFQAASARDGTDDLIDRALADDELYDGLLTVLLRLVFLLYSEERDLLPIEHETFARHYSLLALYDELLDDAGRHPDTMALRFGAWGRLLALFRAVHFGVSHGDLELPPRRGELFDPHRFGFLEGWEGRAAPVSQADARAAVRTPTVDDGTVLAVLHRLLVLDGQRLSYRALDVEQIGSVYEGLMGWRVERLHAPAVCLRPARVWVTANDVRDHKPGTMRSKFLKDECALTKAQATKLDAALSEAAKEHGGDLTDEAALTALDDFAVRKTARAARGRLVLQPGAERRRTSSHYTPRSLSEPIVATTLEPLLAALGEEPTADQILELRICDSAMGSGAFLVAACRWLADQVVAAWTRADALPEGDPLIAARRLVAQRCLYGVDKNEAAVHLAKLSLWLVTMSRDLPFTFVDHALRHGDAVVGLSFEQVKGFHWQPTGQNDLCTQALVDAMDEALDLRLEIHRAAEHTSAEAWREKHRLWRDAEDAMDRVRLIADLVVGAFFAADKKKAREDELQRRKDLVTTWLLSDEAPTEELLGLQADLRDELPTFHWMLEFPEVFHAERVDPLGDSRKEPAYFDAFVGNPPFLGGKRISTEHGDAYAEWLRVLHNGSKNADLSAHFFRRTSTLLGDHGTIGLIATNTIGQGDTRETGLQPLVAVGAEIYAATRDMQWPGAATVTVSVVHLAKGATRAEVSEHHLLDGRRVEAINSRLRGKPERPDPRPLASNVGCAFQGSILLGMGFVLTPDERDDLVKKDPRNAERIFPYLGGEEVNTSPTQSHDRYVINFAQMELEEAERWPDLTRILRENVKQERETKAKAVREYPWWIFWRPRGELYDALASLDRCLVTARVTKHLAFTFQPTNRTLNEKLFVFPFADHSALAVLQSRVHDRWVWLLSSTLGSTLNYSATDCFENFPFPEPDPRTVIPELEDIGRRLDEARAAFMVDTDQGLTKTYNALKDPTVTDPAVQHLRALHLDLDRAVLAAYGWPIDVPPYTTPTTEPERLAHERFEDEIIDHLFQLNADRARQEEIQGLTPGKKKNKKRASKRKPKKPTGPTLFEE